MEIIDLHQHGSNDYESMSHMKKLQNFSSTSNSNSIANNNFIKNDKKLSIDKQQNREIAGKSNQTKSDYLRSGNAT